MATQMSLHLFLIIIASHFFCVNTFCVINKSCKRGHGELFPRLYNSDFSKTVEAGTSECCDPNANGCSKALSSDEYCSCPLCITKAGWGQENENDDLAMWIDCDMDSGPKGQVVVGCVHCSIIIQPGGTITVEYEGNKTIRSVYTCAGF